MKSKKSKFSIKLFRRKNMYLGNRKISLEWIREITILRSEYVVLNHGSYWVEKYVFQSNITWFYMPESKKKNRKVNKIWFFYWLMRFKWQWNWWNVEQYLDKSTKIITFSSRNQMMWNGIIRTFLGRKKKAEIFTLKISEKIIIEVSSIKPSLLACSRTKCYVKKCY